MYNCFMRKNASGFTIVELLIVILILGILTTIAVVAFRGVSDRAVNSKTAEAVVSFEKALRLYQASHGELPQGDEGNGDVCLGAVADYPLKPGYGEGECVSVDEADWRSPRVVDESLNQKLVGSGISVPSVAGSVEFTAGSKRFRGVSYISYDKWQDVDGDWINTGRVGAIYYWIRGEHDSCPKGQLAGHYDGVTGCVVGLDDGEASGYAGGEL